VLLAYTTPDFLSSRWTGQEVGWALGRELVVQPLRVGADPYGFFGSYQAQTVRSDATAYEVAITVSRAITLGILGRQRPGAARMVPRMTEIVVDAFCTSRSIGALMRRFELLQHVPGDAWTDHHIESIKAALSDNVVLRDGVIALDPPRSTREAVTDLLRRRGRSLDS
jgi:hypothetical protein